MLGTGRDEGNEKHIYIIGHFAEQPVLGVVAVGALMLLHRTFNSSNRMVSKNKYHAPKVSGVD